MLQWTLRISTSRPIDYLWLRSPPCRIIPLTQRALATSIRISKYRSLWTSFNSTIRSSIWNVLDVRVQKWSSWMFAEQVVKIVLLWWINSKTKFWISILASQSAMDAVSEFLRLLLTSEPLDTMRNIAMHSAAPPPHTPPHNGGWEFLCRKEMIQLTRVQRKTLVS